MDQKCASYDESAYLWDPLHDTRSVIVLGETGVAVNGKAGHVVVLLSSGFY
jgi:hypothetical protein